MNNHMYELKHAKDFPLHIRAHIHLNVHIIYSLYLQTDLSLSNTKTRKYINMYQQLHAYKQTDLILHIKTHICMNIY